MGDPEVLSDLSALTLRVNERFYSIQGEGARAGSPSLFIRLAGCSAKYACWQSGVACDTEFESGEVMTLAALVAWAQDPAHHGCRWIIWTGGEPLDQLTLPILQAVQRAGFSQALETSGARPFPPAFADCFQWVVVSPKVAEHVLAKHFPATGVDELRYVRAVGQAIPAPVLPAECYYLSPQSEGEAWSQENLRHCLELCRTHPAWRLSLQWHKVLRVR